MVALCPLADHESISISDAQSLNAGVLPTKDIPNTFVAQAYDAGDPCAGGQQCCVNKKDGMGGWPCLPGIAPYTGQFMGGIHPRGPPKPLSLCSGRRAQLLLAVSRLTEREPTSSQTNRRRTAGPSRTQNRL